MEDDRRSRLTIELPEHAGRFQFMAVPEFPPDDPRSKIESSLDGGSGRYQALFVLGVPGAAVYHHDLNLATLVDSGDSLLAVPEHLRPKGNDPFIVLNLLIEGRDCAVRLFLNNQGRIAYAHIGLETMRFADAERAGYDIVSSVLSYLSYQYDVAIEIAGYQIIEERTGIRRWVFGLAGMTKTAELPGAGYHVEGSHRRLLASYREGMNATNVFYKVLAFYKVIEGVRALRRSRIKKAKKEKKKIPISPSEEFPKKKEELYQIFPPERNGVEPYLGKRFTTVCDELRNIIRNAVAHLDPDRFVLDNDRYDDVMLCERAVPTVRYMARMMLANEIPILRFSGEGPTFFGQPEYANSGDQG